MTEVEALKAAHRVEVEEVIILPFVSYVYVFSSYLLMILTCVFGFAAIETDLCSRRHGRC